ncbi:MAG: glycosyltransferase family protein [Candidatus Kapabacteria bacterium]|nr:glycosyltransferase family protein [Candidatus Kapabacteria bacterium]
MSDARVLVICQARLGSTRLPRKVLLPLSGQPLILRFLERVSCAKLATTVVVATTTDASDDLLCVMCADAGYHVYRGHPRDLLDRHYQAAKAFGADVVVKIPSDCPLIDPGIIDEVISAYQRSSDSLDYVSNLHPGTWPDGNDVEVMSMKILERAWFAATKDYEREHTTPWLWDDNAGVRTSNVVWGGGRDLSMSHRWTIDYPEDYMLIKAAYDNLYCVNPRFGIMDILSFLNDHPEIAGVNSHLAGVNWYRSHLAELHTVDSRHTRDYPSSSQTA